MIKIELVTPKKILAEDSTQLVSIPGSEGDLGVLTGHTPFLSGLRVGELRYKKESSEESFFISGGFVEVLPDKVTVLAETAEKKQDIDKDRAQKSLDRAQKRIEEYKANKNAETNLSRAESSLIRAIHRLRVAG